MKLEKIVCLEDLNQYLDDAWAWRKKEITYYIKIIQDSGKQSEYYHYQNRAAILILYAHWEGFVKEALRAYIIFILVQPIAFIDLSPSVKATYLQLKFNLKQNFNSYSNDDWLKLAQHIEQLNNGKLDKLNIKALEKNYPNTKSNLSLNQFNGLLKSLELSISKLTTGQNLLDDKLLNHRNAIAHGDQRRPDTDFHELAHHIVDILEELKNMVFDYANSRQFCVSNSLALN